MDFTISQKTDPETKHSTFTIEGDEDFTTLLNSIAKGIMELIPLIPYIISKKRDVEKLVNEPTGFPNSITLNMGEVLASNILDLNPDFMDRITLIKRVDDTVIGITIK